MLNDTKGKISQFGNVLSKIRQVERRFFLSIVWNFFLDQHDFDIFEYFGSFIHKIQNFVSNWSFILKVFNLLIVQRLNIVDVSAVHLRNFPNFISNGFLKLHTVRNRDAIIDGQDPHFLLKDLNKGRDTGGTWSVSLESSAQFSIDAVDFLFIFKILRKVILFFCIVQASACDALKITLL